MKKALLLHQSLLAVTTLLIWYLSIMAPYQNYDDNYAYWFYAIILSFVVCTIFPIHWSKRAERWQSIKLFGILFIILNNPISLFLGYAIHESLFDLTWKV